MYGYYCIFYLIQENLVLWICLMAKWMYIYNVKRCAYYPMVYLIEMWNVKLGDWIEANYVFLQILF